jgi:prepilin-type N-terminal cleavage/methylation domain-containing protein
MRSTPPSRTERGFSLIELIVATSVMLAVTGVAGAFFTASRKTVQDQIIRTETVQGLRAVLDSMSRDLRLGGACLPVTGDFVVLDGTNGTNSTPDTITTRTGLVRPNESCIVTTTTSDITATTTQIPVNIADGFATGMRVYLRLTNNTGGEFFNLTGVDSGSKKLSKTKTLSMAYPSGSGVYAVDERVYAVDSTSNPNLPALTVTVNGGTAMNFAFGIENLQIKYELEQNCSTAQGCLVVDLPADDATFSLVKQLYITVTARSRSVGLNGQYYRITGTVNAKPRNLLPASS